jgi:hypothetical protein
VAAVSDSSFSIALWTTGQTKAGRVSPDLAGLVKKWTHKPEEGSQWEGLAADDSGRLFVLQEHAGKKSAPPHVFAFAPSLDAVTATLALEVADQNVPWQRKWLEEKNARGEALLLLRNGHLLVFKQKDPVQVIEFGLPGHEPHGFGPERLLGPRDAFEINGGDVRYIPMASWGLGTRDASAVKSINDAAVGHDGSVYVISRTSRVIARLDSDPAPSETVVIDAVWLLPEEIEHPEGLVLLEGLAPLVADDRPATAGGPNLFLLSTLSG